MKLLIVLIHVSIKCTFVTVRVIKIAPTADNINCRLGWLKIKLNY